MISYTQRQGWKGHVATNTDRVFAATAIPRGGVFHGMSFDVHVWGLEQVMLFACIYGVSGYAVPILDPDAAVDFDNIWERQVPKNKAEAEGVLDLDTISTADATPEYEVGMVNWAGVFDMDTTKRLYRRRRVLTAASAGRGPGTTGFATHWLPQDRFRINVAGGFKVKAPTAIMFAFSAPVVGQTTTTALTPPTEKEWVMLQYLEDTAIDALKFLIGLTTGGTQEPYEEAAVFLDKTLAPSFFEETTAEWATPALWEVLAHGSFTCSVPGSMTARNLDGDK